MLLLIQRAGAHDLSVLRGDVPGTALFDLCDVELEEVVQPRDEFLSGEGSKVSILYRTLGTEAAWRSYLDSPIVGGYGSRVYGVQCV